MTVETGLTDGTYTEILSGLNEGDDVIYRGYEQLKESDPVVPAKWGADGPAELPPARGEEVIPGAKYTCPMHPEVVQDKPGDCPKCGMKLAPKNVQYSCPMDLDVKQKESGLCPKCMMKLQPMVQNESGKWNFVKPDQDKGSPAKSAAKGKYYCPMHPEVTSDDPNAKCEKCGGMKLVPRPEEQSKSAKTVYWCPMHPEVTSTDPNAKCEKCGGMKLEPKSKP